MFNPRQRADFALLIVTMLWGLTFPLIRGALEDLEPEWFIASRFVIATVVFLPLVLASASARTGLRAAWVPGLGLGVLVGSSYYFQTLGLTTVPAGRAAFVTGTSVILVPLIAPFFGEGKPTRVDFVAALVATAGMFLLTGPTGDGFGVGDAWILGCAGTYSVYILLVQKVLRRDPDESSLAFTQVATIAMCGLLLLTRTTQSMAWTPNVLVALAVCALLATVGTFWLQMRYQRRTTPQRVALIFAAEPVFAAVFAYWLAGETLPWVGLLGGALILVAVVGAELLNAKAERDRLDQAGDSGSSSRTV